MTKPLLSICIPTYNRARLLSLAIESILSQADETMADLVEIVVSDNASTDETAPIVKRLSARTKLPIKYYKNEQNVGFDQNVLLVVERAQGQFVWILGDDDLIYPGALKELLLELQKQARVDLYFGEKEDFYLTPTRPMRFRRIMKYQEGKVFDFKDKKIMNEYFRHNKKLIAYCNYLSNIIFNREKWLKLSGKEKQIGTGYVHMFVFWSILWGKGPGIMKYLPMVLVKRRWGNDGEVEGKDYELLSKAEARLRQDIQMYRRLAQAVFSDAKYIRRVDQLVMMNDGFSWAVRLKLNDPKGYLFKLLPFIFNAYGDHLLFWFKFVPLVFIPNYLLRFMRGFYRKQVKGEPLGLNELMES